MQISLRRELTLNEGFIEEITSTIKTKREHSLIYCEPVRHQNYVGIYAMEEIN